MILPTDGYTNDTLQYPQDVISVNVDEFEAPFSATVNNCIGCYMTFVATLSVLGNMAVWLMLVPQRSALRPTDFLTLNLALSDFLLAIICWPFAIAAAFRKRWSVGQGGCTFYGFFSYLFIVSSLCSISALAVLRYIKLCKPRIGENTQYKIAFRIIPCIWIYSLLTAMFPILGWNRYTLEPYRISCSLDWISTSAVDVSYTIVAAIQCVVLPLVSSVFCYTAIYKKLYRHKGRSQMRLNLQKRLVKSSVLITVCFVVSWTPYAVVSLWNTYKGANSVPLWASAIPVVLAKSSCVCNPIIYIACNKTFRKDTNELIRCCGCRCCCVTVNENPTNWLRVVNCRPFVIHGRSHFQESEAQTVVTPDPRNELDNFQYTPPVSRTIPKPRPPCQVDENADFFELNVQCPPMEEEQYNDELEGTSPCLVKDRVSFEVDVQYEGGEEHNEELVTSSHVQ